jgi:hypothetical protein
VTELARIALSLEQVDGLDDDELQALLDETVNAELPD